MLLSIPDPENVFRLFTWEILFLVLVDIDRIRTFYEERNIGFEFLYDDDEDYVVALSFPAGTTQLDSDLPVQVSRYFFRRISYEFLSLRNWLEQSVKTAEQWTLSRHKRMASNPALHPVSDGHG